MNNESALQFFEEMSNKSTDNAHCVKLANNSDFTDLDANFILSHSTPQTSMLDIGTGTGLIVNKIYEKVKSIDCIEPFESFTKHIVKSKNISIINKNILHCKLNKKYDLVTAFGCMHYFSETEAKKVYSLIYSLLNEKGKLIIKNQFGLKDDVIVSGYSEEQKKDYFASYRHIEKEIKLLSEIGFKNTIITDIYPTSALQGSGFLFIFGGTYAKSRRNLQVFEIIMFIIIIYMTDTKI